MCRMYIFFNMQIRAAITEKPMFSNMFGTVLHNMTDMVSRPMFLWSKIKVKAFK